MNGWNDASARTGSLLWFGSTRLGLGLKNGWDGMESAARRERVQLGGGGATPWTIEKRPKDRRVLRLRLGAGQRRARLVPSMKKQMFRYTKLKDKRKAAGLERCC